jgi:membrane protein implicated in regulation of membrane protease activity
MPWWVWAVGGLALLGAELFVPVDFFVFFLGVAALGVALVTAIGLTPESTGQLAAFSLLALASMVGLRGPLVARLKRGADESVGVETLVGESATLLGALAPGGVAKAELRGTTWTVRSEHGGELAVGRRCRVERVDGLTLWVRPE